MAIFPSSKYTDWYFNIIYKSNDAKISKKTELHHILPESMFPEYADLKIHTWNGVYLTFKEHYICHLLLFRMTKGRDKSKMFYALIRMFNGKNTLPSRTYTKLKEQYANNHWSNFKTPEEMKEIYKHHNKTNDGFAGATKWFKSLSNEEQTAMHKRQALKRCKGWWISKKDNSIEEFYVLNLKEWCINNNVDDGWACTIANLKSKHYGKQTKSWRIRKDGDPQLPPYIDKRKIGHKNVACKGKTWKLVDGTRVWFEQE